MGIWDWLTKPRAPPPRPEFRVEVRRLDPAEVPSAPPRPPRPPPGPPVCPHCGFTFEKRPTRKRACPTCKGTIVVRHGNLLTAEAAAAHDERMRKESELKAYQQNLDLTPEEWARELEGARERTGHWLKPRDLAWSLYNRRLLEETNPHAKGRIYFQMARLLDREGRPYQDLLREAHKWYARAQPYARTFRVHARACCDTCLELDGREFDRASVLKRPPVPVEACTRGWCNCVLFGDYE